MAIRKEKSVENTSKHSITVAVMFINLMLVVMPQYSALSYFSIFVTFEYFTSLRDKENGKYSVKKYKL